MGDAKHWCTIEFALFFSNILVLNIYLLLQRWFYYDVKDEFLEQSFE